MEEEENILTLYDNEVQVKMCSSLGIFPKEMIKMDSKVVIVVNSTHIKCNKSSFEKYKLMIALTLNRY